MNESEGAAVMSICTRKSLASKVLLAAAISLVPVSIAIASEGHDGHGNAPSAEHAKRAADTDHAKHDGSNSEHSASHDRPMDHSQMNHGEMDHSQMGHGSMNHSRMGHGAPDSSGMSSNSDHHANGIAPRPLIPALTDADREAAFPAIQGHTVHDKKAFGFLLFDQLEYQDADEGSTLAWEISGWWGGDINRVWLRSEGERTNGVTEEAELHLLGGHAVGPWWDVVAGVRQDFKPGSGQTWGALGIQGMPLYGLEVQATGYVGEGGQLAARLEAEYDILLTNRLILQPVAELNFYGKEDSARGIGSGLSESEVGLRLRYEIAREFAPYIGVNWSRAYGSTADLAREEGEGTRETRFVAGVRMWF